MTDNFIMPFSGGELDHVETQRSAEELQKFVANPKARIICFHKGTPAMNEGGGLKQIHPSELIGRNLHDPGPIFLGLNGEIPLFAASVGNPADVTREDLFVELRTATHMLSPEEMALAGRAKSLLDWHINHRFCAKCGQVSQPQEGGVKRKCPSCETEHFPRVNPVVIMPSQDLYLRARRWKKLWPAKPLKKSALKSKTHVISLASLGLGQVSL